MISACCLHNFVTCLCCPSCLQDNSSARTTQKAQPFYCCRGIFTAPLYNNGRGVDLIENTTLLLLPECMLRTIPSNGRCLQSHCLATAPSSFFLPRELCLWRLWSWSVSSFSPWFGLSDVYSPTASAAPSVRPLVTSVSLIRCQSVQLCARNNRLSVGNGVFSMWSSPRSYKEENWGNPSVELCEGGWEEIAL
jgi:hypothetical protein